MRICCRALFVFCVLASISTLISTKYVEADTSGSGVGTKCSGTAQANGSCPAPQIMVDNCDCPNSAVNASGCKAKGSWYCEDSEGAKIKGSGAKSKDDDPKKGIYACTGTCAAEEKSSADPVTPPSLKRVQ